LLQFEPSSAIYAKIARVKIYGKEGYKLKKAKKDIHNKETNNKIRFIL